MKGGNNVNEEKVVSYNKMKSENKRLALEEVEV